MQANHLVDAVKVLLWGRVSRGGGIPPAAGHPFEPMKDKLFRNIFLDFYIRNIGKRAKNAYFLTFYGQIQVHVKDCTLKHGGGFSIATLYSVTRYP